MFFRKYARLAGGQHGVELLGKPSRMIVDDEELARGFLRELLRPHPEMEIVAECAQRLRGRQGDRRDRARSAFSRRADAQARRLRSAGADRPGAGRGLRHGLRPVRHAGLRGPGGRLPAEAVRRRALRTALERAQAAAGRAARCRWNSSLRSAGGRAAAAHRHQGRHARARDSARQAGLRGGAGRLRGDPQRRQELSETAADRGPGNRARPARASCASTAPPSSTWNGSSRIEPYGKESRIAILSGGERLPVSRAGYARLLEAMGDSQGSRKSAK